MICTRCGVTISTDPQESIEIDPLCMPCILALTSVQAAYYAASLNLLGQDRPVTFTLSDGFETESMSELQQELVRRVIKRFQLEGE